MALLLDWLLATVGLRLRRYGDGLCTHPVRDCCDYCCPGDDGCFDFDDDETEMAG